MTTPNHARAAAETEEAIATHMQAAVQSGIQCRLHATIRTAHLFIPNIAYSLCSRMKITDGDVAQERQCYVCAECRDIREGKPWRESQ